jgi:hypothetical protein
MFKRQLQVLSVTIVLVVAILGLGGCRRQETTTNKQMLPLSGSGTSPLPTPGVVDSPVAP